MGGNETREAAGRGCLDQVFVALGHPYRRRILAGLLEDSPRDVDRLLRSWADVETDWERLEVELYHRHLPKLDADGFVDWDGGERVRRGPKFDSVAPVMELLAEHGDELPGEWL